MVEGREREGEGGERIILSNKNERILPAASIDVTEFSHEKFLGDAIEKRNRIAIFYLETSVCTYT